MSPFSTGGTRSTRSIHEMSSVALDVSRSLLSTNNNGNQQQEYLEQFQAPDVYCPYSVSHFTNTCDFGSRFRTFDGTCNNREYPWWGKSESPFKRVLASAYNDGLNEPRKRSTKGGNNHL